MSYTSLAQVLADIKRFSPVSSREEIMLNSVTGQTIVKSDEEIGVVEAMELSKFLLDLIDGGYHMSDMIKSYTEFMRNSSVKRQDIVRFYYEGDEADASLSDMTGEAQVSASQNSTQSTKTAPGVGVIQVLPVGVMPSNRMTDAASIMLSSIPTIEWSRAVPYVDIKLIYARPAVAKDSENNDRVNSLSIARFLDGRNQVSGIEKSIVTAGSFTGGTTEEPIEFSTSGMELFTSPQTLVNANEKFSNSSGLRYAPVIDNFRPLASLESLTINVVPTTGMFLNYKDGKLEFILHDRSRLGELSDLIRPDLYQTTELLIEYGWNHPDNDYKVNPYGALINNAKIKEKYGVKNSSFSFDESGQAKISLTITMRGVNDLASIKIGDSPEVARAEKEMQKLVAAVNAIRENLTNDSGAVKEVRGIQLLDSISDISNAMTLKNDKTLAKQLNSILHSKNTTFDGSAELKKILQDMYDGKDSAANELSNAVQTLINDKISSIQNREKIPIEKSDPALALLKESVQESDNLTGDKEVKLSQRDQSIQAVVGPKNVSLAKLMTHFVAAPIISTGKFDEVQLIFYAFNANAGLMANSNVGSMPIPVEEFISQFSELSQERNTYNIVIQEFMSFLQNNFIDNPVSEAWGLQGAEHFYKITRSKGDVSFEYAKNTDVSALENVVEQRMLELGVRNGKFKQPQIEMYFETVPEAPLNEDTSGNLATTILRIHVFDKVASNHTAFSDLLEALSEDQLASFTADVANSSDLAKHSANAKRVLQMAEAADLVESIEDSADSGTVQYRLIASPTQIKDFVRSNVPTIRYGTNGSAIKSAGLRTIHDPLLSTVHMQRTGVGDVTSPAGVDSTVLPVWMIPTEMEVDALGCPFIQYGQQYFIDFDTGTTVDNVYGVSTITHEIRQGSFNTRFKMNPIDSHGTYRSMLSTVSAAINVINSYTKSK